MTDEEKRVVNLNTDTTINSKAGQAHKAMVRSVFDFENLMFFDYFDPTFGSSIYLSLLNGMSSVFKWNGLPKEIPTSIMERFLIAGGRMKMIKVGQKYYVVHIAATKWNNYYDVVKSTIIEPWLPGVNNKHTEGFKNVELKNNNMGYSLGRAVYPFLKSIDEALFNLDIHMKLLSGKFGLIQDEADSTDEDDNDATTDSVNQWIIDGRPVKIFSADMMMDGKLPLMKIEVQDSTQSFIEEVRFMMSKMSSAIGIPNDNFEDKKERKITSEITVQNIHESSVIEDMLNARQRAAEKINEVFGLNVSVEVNPNYLPPKEPEQEGEQEDVLE